MKAPRDKLKIKNRKYTNDDYQFTHDLHRENMISYINKYWGNWDSQIFRKDVYPDNTWIIENETENIGFFVLEFDGKAYLRNIQISSSFQNKRVGNQVLQHCDNESVISGFSYLYLDVFLNNPAKSLYDRLNYKTYKMTKSHYLMKKFLKDEE